MRLELAIANERGFERWFKQGDTCQSERGGCVCASVVVAGEDLTLKSLELDGTALVEGTDYTVRAAVSCVAA
eukprot:6192311-Pleurochrysis_carterae.AAC.4